MLGKPAEVKVGRPRDGRHCDLCGCSFPAVRCDKCGSQIFCLSCDDMYHRHPKRRFHLRKAVDPTPTPQARPVLPMKASQLSLTPGDPSKMPLPPPRKKKPGKSFFDTFRRGSPSSENSPPLPKKEYSWTDRLGSIKKFMSNRPLPPLPKDEDNQEENSPPLPRKNDLSFIHKKVDEKPPQLPHRVQAKSPNRKVSAEDFVSPNWESSTPDKQAKWTPGFGPPSDNFRQMSPAPHTPHLNGQVNRDSSERELSAGRFRSRSLQEDMPSPGIRNFAEQPNLSPTMPPDFRGYSTLKRPPSHSQDVHNQSFASMPTDHFPGMHHSSSVTDLHSLDSPSHRGPQQFPNFPMPPHYPHPYPMYPHYPNYPQYFGTSFANLSTALPTTDVDFSDHSEASSLGGKKNQKHSAFGVKAKRSQSVMYDRMAYPPQYYPFGGFPPHPPIPGYGAAGPWGQSDHPIEAPPSPATSVRSIGRSRRSRQRKKKMIASENDEEDERLSVRSSPRSRTTSSSDRLRKRKTPKKFERSVSPSSLTSSEEKEENQAKEDQLLPEVHMDFSQGDGYQTKQDKKKVNKQVKEATKSEHKNKQHGSKSRVIAHQKLKTDEKHFSPKFKKKEKVPLSSSESMDVSEEQGLPVRKTENKSEDDTQDKENVQMREESPYHSDEDVGVDKQVDEPSEEPTLKEGQWQCEHCTFINNIQHRICQVCCKTKPGSLPQSDATLLVVPETQLTSSSAASPDIPALNTTSESITSDTAKEFMTPPAVADEDRLSIHSEDEGHNFAKLSSDLEQAEKELSRGLMELMKLKEESDVASPQTTNTQVSDDSPATKENLITQGTTPEPQAAAAEAVTTLSQLTEEIQVPFEKVNYELSVLKTEHVSSKSIGIDSMNVDFAVQTQEPETIIVPTVKTSNFGSYAHGQISELSTFPEMTAASPSSSQVDTAVTPALRRDSSCQTYQNDSVTQTEAEIPPYSHADAMDFQYPLNRADSMKSPQLPPIAPSGYRGFGGRGQGLMHRSHSRSSLFGDRYSDSRPMPPDLDNLGFGYGPSPMYRSLSRSSLAGDYSDPWMSDARTLRRPDFYLSMEELVERRRLETKRAQGLELVRMIRDAEQQGFTADDIHVALNNCGKQNPVDWLQTNWKGMVDTVVTLATNYGKDKHENDIGILSENEARDSLRIHKGNIWAAVTECVEGRQRKFLELKARGNFSTKEIVDVLTQSEGNVELAYARLSATTLKPFLMRIWGAGEGVENQDGAVCDPAEFFDPGSSEWPKSSTLRARNSSYGDAEHCSDQEDWDYDDDVEEEVSWNEDEDEEGEVENPENFDLESQTTERGKRGFVLNHIATPESDSEYCDAFDPVGDARSATSSSPADENVFTSPDHVVESQKDKKKGTSFLSRLAALRKNKKPQAEEVAEKDHDQSKNFEADSSSTTDVAAKNEHAESSKFRSSNSHTPNSDANKIYGPLNMLKQTFSAIKDSVIGSNNKNESRHPRSITEARTIIVHDRTGKESLFSAEYTENSGKNVVSDSANKNEEIKDIPHESHEKNEPIQQHVSENLKDHSLNKVLPTTVMDGAQVPHASTPLLEAPLKNQVRGMSPERKNNNVREILNKSQEKFESVCSKEKTFQERSTEIMSKTLPLKSMEDSKHERKGLIFNSLEKQSPEKGNKPIDIKDTSVSVGQPTPENFGDTTYTVKTKVADGQDKISDTVKSSDITKKSLSKYVDKGSSSEVVKDGRTKDHSVPKPQSYSKNVTDTVDDKIIVSTVAEADKSRNALVITNSETKHKIKKQKNGLRLKLPDTETSIKTKPELQRDVVPDRSNLEDDAHIKQTDLKKTNDEGAAENQTISAEETTSTVEKSETNISKDEFHHMASKITEKMENCLEVFKSSENIFIESEQRVSSLLDKQQGMAAPDEMNQNKNTSEMIQETSDEIGTNVPKICTKPDMAEKLGADIVSLSLLNHHEKSNYDVSQSVDAVKGTINSSGNVSSSEAVLQSNESSEVAKGNADTFLANSIPDNASRKDGDNVNLAKLESPLPELTPSIPATKSTDNSSETPVKFAGVKAKPFAGIFNKKAKNQLPGSDKKQKDVSTPSPTPQTPATIRSEISEDKEDYPDVKQMPTKDTKTYTDEQARQGEIAPHAHFNTVTEEGKASPITKDEITSDKNQNQSLFTVQTDFQQPENLDTPQIKNQVAKGAAESMAKIVSGRDLEREDSKTKEEEFKNAFSRAKSDASDSFSNKVSEASDQIMKDISLSVKDEASVSTLIKAPESEFKEQEDQDQTEVQGVKDQVKEQEAQNQTKEQGAKSQMKELEAENQTKQGAGSQMKEKGEKNQTKEQQAGNALITANAEAIGATSSKDEARGATSSKDEARGAISSKDEAKGAISSKDEVRGATSSKDEARGAISSKEEARGATSSKDEARGATSSKGEARDATSSKDEARGATSSKGEATTTTSRDDTLDIESQEKTETYPVQENNASSPPTTSGEKKLTNRIEALKNSPNDAGEFSQGRSQSPLRPQSPFSRMTSLSARKEAIAQERNKETRKTPTNEKKPWFIEKVQPPKSVFPKKSIKQQLEFERKIRKLVSERKCRTYRKAEIVVQLEELNFVEKEALQAANECSTLEQAISYLQQECLLCAGMYPVGQIVSMIHCPHKACRECIKAYFTIQIRDRTIMELQCPFCNEPDISDEDVVQDYFNHLDILLKELVEPDIHELFQRKLRDRVLMKDPNFRWCSQCSSGFIAMPNLKRLICPDCNAITCANCRRPWERDHEGISCEAFAAWKDANDPESHNAGLEKLLEEDGIDCPNCHFRYTLAKGGCMHFRCIQCQHDFCSGCSKPFKMGQKCGVSDYCGKLGLHAHHPRNCLFYLRDKDPEDLQRLLELNDVNYNEDPPDGTDVQSVCQVMEQKETPEGLVDDICGKEVLEGQAGLCRVHYVEYLGQLVNKHKIDPIQIFCNDDLELVLKRASKRLPAKSYRDTEVKYREKLVQLIQEELPLELTDGS